MTMIMMMRMFVEGVHFKFDEISSSRFVPVFCLSSRLQSSRADDRSSFVSIIKYILSWVRRLTTNTHPDILLDSQYCRLYSMYALELNNFQMIYGYANALLWSSTALNEG